MKIKRKKGPKPGRSSTPPNQGDYKSRRVDTFKGFIRERLAKKEGGRDLKELAETGLRKALMGGKGSFNYWSKLIELYDSRAVNEDELQELVEFVYITVRRHVEKLEGGAEALAAIAKDLQRMNEHGNPSS